MTFTPSASSPPDDPARYPPGKPVSYAVLHQQALEKVGPATILIDHYFRIVHLSESASRYLRHVGGEPSHHLLTLVHPDLRPDLRATTHGAIQANRSAASRLIPFFSDGNTVDIRISVSPFHSKDTRENLLLVMFEQAPTPNEKSTATKIGLRTRNEALVATNEELQDKLDDTLKINDDLLSLVSSGNIITVFVDSSMRVKWFTPQALELFALRASDHGRPLQEITHRLLYPKMMEDTFDAFMALRVVEQEVQTTDGRWYLAKILPYRSVGGRVEGAVLNFNEITERVKAQQALREGLERLRLLSESTTDFAMISMDRRGRITGWNRAAELMFGYSAAEMQGGLLDRIFTEEDQAARRPLEELRMAREHGHADDERWHVRKDGSRLYCSGVVYPLIDGGLKGYAKIARDLTDKCIEDYQQQSVLEQWKASNVLKDQFIAIMSHELRHPLNLIQLNMELLSRTPELLASARAQSAIDAIRRAVQNQSQLIGDLLDLSRVQTGKLKLDREPVQVMLAIDTVLDAVSAQAREAQVTLHGPDSSLMDAERLVVEGDASRIEQIVWNLLSNAIKFTPPGGTVTVSVSIEANELRVDIKDTGIGIPAHSLEKAFAMFGQVEHQHKRGNRHGLGIGLPLVAQLVQAHSGRVVANSAGEGQGSTFSIWLPLAGHGSIQEGRAMANSFEALKGVRLMLVDDSEEIVSMLAALCEMEGAQVSTALDGQQALSQLESMDFDILITDLGMPVMDGCTLLTRLRAGTRNATIPAIALTGYGQSEQASAIGFTDQLCKPVPMKELLAKLTELVAQGRVNASAREAEH